MKSFAAVLALAGAVAAFPQAVTSKISPSASAPSGCATNYASAFEISVVNVTSSKRAAVTITLANGVLTDSEGRTGYIASNDQFQFDNPVQAGAIYTAGWSVCSNGSLALGGSAIFYECLSGTFYNLYDESLGAQCAPIYIDVVNVGGATTAAATVTQLTDGQVQASTAVSTSSTGRVVTQITDGQIQASTSKSSTATGAIVTQITDGQIQASTAKSSSSTVTGRVVTQITDGQIQATTSKAASSTVTGRVVTQISDGQIQATTASNSSAVATLAVYTGGAALPTMGAMGAIGAGVLALAML